MTDTKQEHELDQRLLRIAAHTNGFSVALAHRNLDGTEDVYLAYSSHWLHSLEKKTKVKADVWLESAKRINACALHFTQQQCDLLGLGRALFLKMGKVQAVAARTRRQRYLQSINFGNY